MSPFLCLRGVHTPSYLVRVSSRVIGTHQLDLHFYGLSHPYPLLLYRHRNLQATMVVIVEGNTVIIKVTLILSVVSSSISFVSTVFEVKSQTRK